MPALVLLVLDVVGGGLALIVIGIPVLLLSLPATRWLANLHRAMAGRVLGTPIPPQYRATRSGGPVGRLAGWAADPMTWRDLAWLVAACTLGFALALLAVLLLVLVVTGALWWFGIEPIMRARSTMDRWFLGYGHTEVLEQRVQVLTATRAETLDDAAAELRRVERDLHDGAQARLVALSMTLGLADSCSSPTPRRPGGWSTTRAPRPAPRSATCARSCAASTRRCSPTAASAAPSRRSRWTCPLPSR